MIFANMRDSHDKRADLFDHIDNLDDTAGANAPIVTNLNLVGIRRRLNNVEIGVWLLVAIVALNTWRHW